MVACAVINRANKTKSNKRRDRNTVSDARFFKLPKVISAQCRRTHELSKKRRSMWLAKINRGRPGREREHTGVQRALCYR